MDDRKFLEDKKHYFIEIGEFKKNNAFEINDKLTFEYKNEKNVGDSRCFYAICCLENGNNFEIKYIGTNQNIEEAIKGYSEYKVYDSRTTYPRIYRNIRKCLTEGIEVKLYAEFKDVSNYKEYKKECFTRYGGKPEWNKRISEYLKQNDNEEKFAEAIYNDDLDELTSNSGIPDAKRSQKVRNAALENAKNMCCCDNDDYDRCKYFDRRKKIKNNTKYLEVHHLVPLWSEKLLKERYAIEVDRKKLDVIENTVCLCSNCHRKIHNGSINDVAEMLKKLYKIKENDLKKAGLDISEKELIEIYKNF